jgi:tRNA pseudouridine55 synthase
VKIDGERAYRLQRRGVEVEMPSRRSVVHSLVVEAYDGTTARLSLHVSSGTYIRSVAEALGGHCTTLRRTSVGPFSVDEADDDPAEARMLEVSEALDRLPADALDRVSSSVRAGVLAVATSTGEGAA